MKRSEYGEPELFQSFLKSAQYIARIKTQQDAWEDLGKLVVTYFPADWVAFGQRDAEGISVHHCTSREGTVGQSILTEEVRILITDVLESGFIATRVLLAPMPSMTALVPILEQLSQAAADTHTPVHIIHWGDSHTAADEFTDELRQRFQRSFGSGGSGFSLAGRPFLGYRRFDARGGGTPLWHAEGLRAATGDGWFGLGGVSIAAAHAGQSVYLDTDSSLIEVHYLQQPGGGLLRLYSGDELLDDFPTDGELAPGVKAVELPPGPHRVRLVTASSRPVRLFGWVADKPGGVTYEALGINGAEAGVILKWNADMLATYLQRRNPGMIVLAYGTNEATDSSWSVDGYRQMFGGLLERLRRAAPTASILVIGPADRWRYSQRKWQVVPGIDNIVEAQQAACREHACTFWDTRARMGGAGSMRDWVYAGLAQWDYVHFTVAGYRRLAAAIFGDLMEQFDAYQKTRNEIGGAASQGQADHGQTDKDR